MKDSISISLARLDRETRARRGTSRSEIAGHIVDCRVVINKGRTATYWKLDGENSSYNTVWAALMKAANPKLTPEERRRLDELRKGAIYDGRTCLSIYWHKTEADAEEHGRLVKKLGLTYNGGMFHGMECGREPGRDSFDREAKIKLYATTE